MTSPDALARRVEKLETAVAVGEMGPATWKDLILAAAGEPYERSADAPRWADLLNAAEDP